jgi:hypothetical protein
VQRAPQRDDLLGDGSLGDARRGSDHIEGVICTRHLMNLGMHAGAEQTQAILDTFVAQRIEFRGKNIRGRKSALVGKSRRRVRGDGAVLALIR